MDRQTLQRLKEDLLRERQAILSRLDNMNDGALGIALEDSIGELSMYDNHPADVGSETFERSKDFALRQSAKQHLKSIDDALKRIENGTYGKCQKCGAEIPAERLFIMPATTLCIKCRRAIEEIPDRHPRPIEEDVISPPFGGRMHDDSEWELGDAEDENEFDGEDTWQAVARYGTSETPQDIGNVVDYNHMYIDWDEDVGYVEGIEQLPYEKNLDGIFYKDFDGEDDETIHSREKIGVQNNFHLTEDI